MANVSGTSSKANNWRSCFHLQPEPGTQALSPWLSEQRDKSILHYGERVSLCTCNNLKMALVVRTLNHGSQHVLFFHRDARADRQWQVSLPQCCMTVQHSLHPYTVLVRLPYVGQVLDYAQTKEDTHTD